MRKKLRPRTLIVCFFVLSGAGLLGAWMKYGGHLFPRFGKQAPFPAGGEEEEEEEGGEGGKQALIKAYFELTHRAAPGTNWRRIELENAVANERYKRSLIAAKATGGFAGGLVKGVWYERGNNNTAGRMSSFAYDAPSNTLYAMSDAGTLWKTNPPAGSWTLLNDDYKLASKSLAISPISGGRNRIFMARDSQLVYSDDNGASLHVASGIAYPMSWAGNALKKIIAINDSLHSVYAIVTGWNPNPWGQATWIFHSADTGKSFSKLRTFMNLSPVQLDCFSPHQSGELYMLGAWAGRADTLYQIVGDSLTVVRATISFPSTAVQVALTGLISGGALQLYALLDNSDIFQSSDTGASWSYINTTPSASWNLLSSSTTQLGRIFFGNTEAYRSGNGGLSFAKVNSWTDYYGNEVARLHADIQAINFFQDTSGNEFCIVGTDGGAYYSNDYLTTVSNMSLSGLKVNQLWHHVTDPNNPAVLYSGMQDQGLCQTNAASGTGLITQRQIISGDYGQMCISGSGGMLWAEYPGGNMYLYGPTLANPIYQATWSMKGSQKPNAAWMLPTASIPGTNDDILIGGGNISGGSGSYLVKLSYVSGAVNATQFPFDFRAASSNGGYGLSALAVSPLDPRLWFAATEDGTFFHSSNSGNSWTKATGFAGPTGYWLYGAAIAPSRKTKGTVYFGGSGYNNPGVYVSRDTGRTFTAMSNGLPATLVNSLAVAPNDSLIFAATDAGPYVFITAQQQWYPLIEASTPGCVWRTVEFLPSIRTARFSTYGRGVWDFVLDAPAPNSVAASQLAARSPTIYPNPVSAGSIIHIQGLPAHPAQLSLFDLSGRRLGLVNWNGSDPLRMPALPAGNYVYRIVQDGQAMSGTVTVR